MILIPSIFFTKALLYYIQTLTLQLLIVWKVNRKLDTILMMEADLSATQHTQSIDLPVSSRPPPYAVLSRLEFPQN